jgi:hypothetical protein
MKNKKLLGLAGCIISVGLLMFNIGWTIFLIVTSSSPTSTKLYWLPIIDNNPLMWWGIIMLTGCVGAVLAGVTRSKRWFILAAVHFVLYALEACAS